MSVMELPRLRSDTPVEHAGRAAMSVMDLQLQGQTRTDCTAPAAEQTRPLTEQLFAILSIVCLFLADVALVAGAFLLAYAVRFLVPDDTAMALGIDQYARMGLLVGLIATLLLAVNGFYDKDRIHLWPSRLQSIVSSVSTALVVAAAVSFFLGNQPLSRLWFAFSWSFAILGLAIWRTIAHRLDLGAHAAIASMKRVVIVGANPLGEQLASELASHCRVVGFVDNGTDLPERGSWLSLLGPIAQLENIVATHRIDELVIALPSNRREQISRSIARGFRRPVTVKFLPDLDDLLPQRFEVQHFAGRRFIGFAPVAHVSWLKRVADLILGGLGLVALAPLIAAIALLIKLDSPGPIFYGQVRIGKDGRHFRMLKFRSMRQNADRLLSTLACQNEATGPLFKMRNDPRVTRVGRVLRRLSLDELPQIFNVLKGEMSLVGPRPPLPSEVAKYEDWQLGRLRAVPGMTGLWQVSGRSEVPFLDMVRLDLHYIRNWSLALDVTILLRTIPAVLASRGAY